MAKIKILFLYSTRGFAGLGRNLSIILNNIDLNSFEPIVVFLGDVNDRDALLEEHLGKNRREKIVFYSIDEKRKLNFSAIEKIKEIAAKHQADVISCHGYKAKFHGALMSFGMTQKFLSIAHGWVTPGVKVSIYYFLDKLVSHCYDKIVLVAEGQREQLRGFLIPQSKLCVINNAIDVKAFTQDVNPLNIPMLDKENLLIGVVSRLSPEKDVKNTIRGFAKALSSKKNLQLVIAGDGPERVFLENLCAELNVEKKVTFLGQLSETAPFFALIDMFVSSSLKEGLPNSLLEAQAFAVPSIITNISGHSDVVLDEKTAFLIDPSNPTQLSDKILKLAENRDEREKLGEAGKLRVKKHFSVSQRIEKLEKVYGDLVQKTDSNG